MILRGDRNQCPKCGEYFNSSKAFGWHRTGEFEKGRRCRTVAEMQARGMVKSDSGFWITEMMDSNAVAAKNADSLADENEDY